MGRFQKILSVVAFVVFATARAAELNGGKPQSLTKKDYVVCGHKLKLEVADDEEKREIGLMNRPGSPAAGTGMLFAFADARVMNFWMKDCPFDLDIVYFDAKGHAVKILTMKATSPLTLESALPLYSSEKPAIYAVEATPGLFAKVKSCTIKPLPSRGH